jgi:hypothetical protein
MTSAADGVTVTTTTGSIALVDRTVLVLGIA